MRTQQVTVERKYNETKEFEENIQRW